MKKLHRKGAVHPTPPVVSDHLLSLLPTAILILTTALSPEEKEVLAYLISCSSNSITTKTSNKITDHAPCFNCNCFRCYMSYWVKWDSSPNRHLIHQIIDGFEENLPKDCNKNQKTKKERSRGHKGNSKKAPKEKDSILGFNESSTSSISNSSTSVEMSMTQVVESSSVVGDELEIQVEEEEEMVEKGGSVRRFMGFLGGKIWSVWG